MKNPHSLNKELASQLAISGASEAIGMSVAIGSVLVARKALPQQIKQLERFFSRLFAKWHGASPEMMTKAAGKATDFMLMNIGGISSMASQFTLHRLKTPEDEKLPVSEEVLRVLTGRIAGTLGAISLVALAEHHAGGALRRTEQSIQYYLPFTGQRISELMLSNLLQSAGALAPNAAAQVLFDHLIKRNSGDEGMGK